MTLCSIHLESLTCKACLLYLLLVPQVLALLQSQTKPNGNIPSRREFVSKVVPVVFLADTMNANPAYALKERNEVLCGTGFFTNIAQYKCTDLGDISDEGKSRKISTEEIGTMEALLGKMGVADAVNKERQDLPATPEGKRGDSKEESRL